MELLAAVVALVCIYIPVRGANECSGLRHLENGRTFFRYGGLLVLFRCHPGYKLHGHKTNSCVSGHWSRDPPVCVGFGCSNPGPLNHGTSSMNEDGSWVVFSCNSGFHLRGPSMLYCKGLTWNSTKPVCKESDMMSLLSGVSVQKPYVHQNLQDAIVLKTQQQPHYNTFTNTVSKEANLKFGLWSHTPSQMSNSEKIIKTNPKVHLQPHIQFSSFKIKDGLQTTHVAQLQKANEIPGTGSHSPDAKASSDEAENVDTFTQIFASKSYLSTTISSALSLVSGTERFTSSPPLLSVAQTSDSTVVTKYTLPAVMFAVTSPLHHTKSDLPLPDSEKDEDQQAETGFQYPPLFQTWSAGRQEPTETSAYNLSTSPTSPPASYALSLSLPVPTFSAPTSQSSLKTKVPHLTFPSDTSTTTNSRSQLTGFHNSSMNTTSKAPMPSLRHSRRPVCPYPPVPAHGTFYFRNVENPGPSEYRHYIQYACYPGYTLAHGDIHSYCQQGGTWSGITPVCLELTPCSVNNGGCSQLCSHSHHYNQISNQTETRTQCHCTPGFILLDDRRTCRDVDECVEGLHQCQQRCINTFGSFSCGCDDGYQPARYQAACTDVDECLLPVAVTSCVFGCVNTPGSFYCQCPPGYSLQSGDSHCQDIDECAINQGLGPCMELCHNSPGSYRCSCAYGHILAGDGHSCIAECPPGYRKQPPAPPENSTSQILKEECVDINECQEEGCEWQCINLPGSYHCICPRGYTLQKDGRRCKDINECSWKNGGCSHLCVNQKGGYKCTCPATHRLSSYSWKKCLPRATANTAG